LISYGIVLREEGQTDQAREVLAESVRAYPWNWSAWLDLTALPSLSWEHIARLDLPHHIMRCVLLLLLLLLYVFNLLTNLFLFKMLTSLGRDFFYAQASLEFQQINQCLRIYDLLAAIFPHSDFLLAQRAIAHYHSRGTFSLSF
jgi:tetratricopeptide (TPR) repeat protein